jgi:hypothetical protein
VTLLEFGAADGGSAPSITGVHNFLAPFMPNLFSSFGLPERLEDADPVIGTALL